MASERYALIPCPGFNIVFLSFCLGLQLTHHIHDWGYSQYSVKVPLVWNSGFTVFTKVWCMKFCLPIMGGSFADLTAIVRASKWCIEILNPSTFGRDIDLNNFVHFADIGVFGTLLWKHNEANVSKAPHCHTCIDSWLLWLIFKRSSKQSKWAVLNLNPSTFCWSI